MRRRHQLTLEAIFSRPTPANIAWDDIVSLLVALEADVSEREGSRVAVALNGRVTVLHRPHPQKEVKRTSVRDIREFLEAAGVTL
jgi:hypothetical protein